MTFTKTELYIRFCTKRFALMGAVLGLAMAGLPSKTRAQDQAAEKGLTIELNALTQLDGGACRLTFLARNSLDTDVEKLVLETVLLTRAGKVDRLTLFDMRDLPSLKPRVRQFDVPELPCATLGQVLINGVDSCDGLSQSNRECGRLLEVSSRTEVEMLG